ncbi:mitochondrial protein [Pterulicium gracile]|uniref:MICOS complex subunit MIC60 n=1 Tax=Pterulicium gracile TaxID=1884261 RepID=A0A5C3QQE0_9AGAR|nr:mitochondrial protein [Pterula gracilis]
MYRLPVSKHVALTSGRNLTRVGRRRLATDASLPPKKSRTFRKILFTTTGLTATFYAGSAFLAFSNQPYYDFFADNVPLGTEMLEYAEANHWDTITLEQAMQSPQALYAWATRLVENVSDPQKVLEDAKRAADAKIHEARQRTKETFEQSKTRVQHVVDELKTDVKKDDTVSSSTSKHIDHQLSHTISELVKKAEDVLQETALVPAPPPPTADSASFEEADTTAPEVGQIVADPNVYAAPLPVGFEPPPGFSRPAPPKVAAVAAAAPGVEAKEVPKPVSLPFVTPAVSDLSASEPIIAQLAGTIDNLAAFLETNPVAASKAADILEIAKVDLTSLATRIEKAKEEERVGLERKLDEQTREYSLKLLELEMEAQDKLDHQESDFKRFFDEERQKFVQVYREKLEHELRTQTELINERLKEEVIAQGIELQRRWIREIKVRVENERGGRLAKLEELSANLKRLERIALDNNAILDENIRIHALWSAVRNLGNVVDAPVRRPFREELRTLRTLATAADSEDAVVVSALHTLESTETPDIGVEPFADLASWFSSSVAPRLSQVALVPEQDAGVLSHLASHLFSTLQFRRHGLVEGSDVISIVARAEYYLNEKDLDRATRELNQLRGTAGTLVIDWLHAARKRLEVQQALEVIQTQATLGSLLVI